MLSPSIKIAVGLALAALATSSVLHAGPPGRIDAGKRATRVSTEEKAVLPENKSLERNEVLMDKRFGTETVERKDALVGERRSSITVEERREKQRFATPDQKKYEVIERKKSAWNGKTSRFSTSEDAYRSKVATRFQDKIGEASPIMSNVNPVVSQLTTFDKVNRFAFRKNSDQTVSVSTAGSERAPTDASKASSVNEAGAQPTRR